MKEYLGLGVVFSAVDRGLAKSMNTLMKSLGTTNDKMKETEEKAANKGKKGGLFNGLFEGMKLLSISHIGSTLNDMQEAMSGVGGGIEDTFKKLDTLKTKLTFTFDGKQAQSLNTALLTTMHNAGLTGDEIEIMAQGMMEFGRSTDEAVKSLPMMGKLVGVMGLDAEKVSKMYGQGLATLNATPDAIGAVIKETVALQKAYHLTDQVSQLPEIFESVTKNSAMFGKVNAQTALSTVRSISGLSAVFQKVGLSQTQALNAATGFGDKLTSMKRSIADMRAGLEPLDNDIFEAANTLSLMGYSGQEAFDKILAGQENPMKFAEEMNGQFMKLSKDQQDIVAARFRRLFGDEATNLMQGYGDQANKAFKVGEKTPQKEVVDKTFDQYDKSLQGTVAVQEKFRDAAKATMEIMTSFVNKDATIKSLQAQTIAWDDLTKSVTDTDSMLGKVITTLARFKDLGLSGFFPGLAAFSILLGLLTPLIFPLTNLVSIFKILGAPLKLVGKLFGFLSKSLGTAGMGFKAILRPLKLLAVIAEHLYVHIGVRLISAFELLQKGALMLMRFAITPLIGMVQALGAAILATPIGWIIAGVVALGLAIAAIIYYWDDITAAATKFFNYLGKNVKSVADMMGFTDVWNGLTEGFDKAMKYISDLWKETVEYFKGSLQFGKEVLALLGFGGKSGEETKTSGSTTEAPPVRSNVLPFKQQPGVPALPGLTSIADKESAQSSDPNIQLLINEIQNLNQTIMHMAEELAQRPVNITLQGDAKKLFRMVNQEQKNQMGSNMAGGAY